MVQEAEDWGRIDQSIRHDQIFLMLGSGNEGCFEFILLSELYEAVGAMEI